jgi:hypothetical protein
VLCLTPSFDSCTTKHSKISREDNDAGLHDVLVFHVVGNKVLSCYKMVLELFADPLKGDCCVHFRLLSTRRRLEPRLGQRLPWDDLAVRLVNDSGWFHFRQRQRTDRVLRLLTLCRLVSMPGARGATIRLHRKCSAPCTMVTDDWVIAREVVAGSGASVSAATAVVAALITHWRTARLVGLHEVGRLRPAVLGPRQHAGKEYWGGEYGLRTGGLLGHPARTEVTAVNELPWLRNEVSVVCSVQSGSGAHPVPYRMHTGALSPGLKRLGRAADHSHSSSAEVKTDGDIHLLLHEPLDLICP